MNEIEFKQIFKFISRNSKVLSYIIFSGFLIAIINAITKKEIWQGQFQIVLEDKSSPGISRLSEITNQNPLLSNMSNSGAKKLKTEVEILKSPSILMSVLTLLQISSIIMNFEKVSFKKWLDKYRYQINKRNISTYVSIEMK